MAVTLDRDADWPSRSHDAPDVRDWTPRLAEDRNAAATFTPPVCEPPVRTARFRGAVVRNHGRLPTRREARAFRETEIALLSRRGHGRCQRDRDSRVSHGSVDVFARICMIGDVMRDDPHRGSYRSIASIERCYLAKE